MKEMLTSKFSLFRKNPVISSSVILSPLSFRLVVVGYRQGLFLCSTVATFGTKDKHVITFSI